jgi:D-aminopeptidase
MQPLYPIGPDIWRMPCQRSMDAPAPGDWTVHFRRDHRGKIAGATIGCWLARRIRFEKRE